MNLSQVVTRHVTHRNVPRIGTLRASCEEDGELRPDAKGEDDAGIQHESGKHVGRREAI